MQGEAIYYLADSVTEEDVDILDIERGSHKHQAVLEFLALLVAVRVWKEVIGRQRWTVKIRTDSTAALGAACRLRSSDPRMNAIARELALDLAEAQYELDLLEHLPGISNELADALSRLSQPGSPAMVPNALARAMRAKVEARSRSWWRAKANPDTAGDILCDPSLTAGDADFNQQASNDPVKTNRTDVADARALGGNTEETDEVFQGVEIFMGVAVAGEPWDLLRGGEGHNVMSPAPRARLQGQIRRSEAIWWAPECCTFSRARGRPVPGARHWPQALRSTRHPYGLPDLGRPEHLSDRKRVEIGNAIAEITFEDAAVAHAAGKGIVIENPASSFMWEIEEAQRLAGQPGMCRAVFCNCMFRGGKRRKQTAVLTNIEELCNEIDQRMCHGRDICDRTGVAHLTWAPAVRGGVITELRTKGEAAYPVGLCDAVGRALWRWKQRRRSPDWEDIVFTEVFSGPRALLSARVARHLAVGLSSSSSFSSSRA